MKYFLILLAFIMLSNSYAKEFTISTNFGCSFPLGNFRDNSNIYSKCNKDAYVNNPNIKIENIAMNNNLYYEFSISYNINKEFKFNAILNKISNKFAGINVTSSQVDVNTNQLINKSTSPEFNSTNLCLGFDYEVIKFDKLSLYCGVEPNIAFINYNFFFYYPTVPTPILEEDKISKTCLGINGKIGAEYTISNDLSMLLSFKYAMIFTDYNNGALSIAYSCFPQNDYFTNPKYIIFNIGIGYKIF